MFAITANLYIGPVMNTHSGLAESNLAGYVGSTKYIFQMLS